MSIYYMTYWPWHYHTVFTKTCNLVTFGVFYVLGNRYLLPYEMYATGRDFSQLFEKTERKPGLKKSKNQVEKKTKEINNASNVQISITKPTGSGIVVHFNNFVQVANYELPVFLSNGKCFTKQNVFCTHTVGQSQQKFTQNEETVSLDSDVTREETMTDVALSMSALVPGTETTEYLETLFVNLFLLLLRHCRQQVGWKTG